MTSIDLQRLFGHHPHSQALKDTLNKLSGEKSVPDPDVKAYSDAVYFNYYSLGLSILFSPQHGYKPKTGQKYADLDFSKLVLDSIDVYNIPKPKESAKSRASRSEIAYSTFPLLPLSLSLATDVQDKDGKKVDRPDTIRISQESTGKSLVEVLGEPDRKGGGAGPSSGSIGIWCEWSKDGIMIEFGGEEARGPQAWERGKDAVWKVITLFQAKPSS